MKFNKNYFKEYKDMFNYFNIVKTVNPNYRLFFNNKHKKFAIINISNNFEICCEFDCIFKNIINKLRFCKIENINKILEKLDNDNETLENNYIENNKNIMKYSLNETLNIINRSSTINNNDIKNIIGATKC